MARHALYSDATRGFQSQARGGSTTSTLQSIIPYNHTTTLQGRTTPAAATNTTGCPIIPWFWKMPRSP